MMTREEAIEVYNGLINAKIREAFEFFVPELRESEDERIRKAIIEFIKQSSISGSLRSCLGISEEQMIAYLEKQKEQKPAEQNYDNRIQYDSVKSGIEAFASTYSFNIESKLFSQLTKEQQQLWRKEIEQAAIAGGEYGIELSRDNRYKENRTIEWSEEDEDYMNAIITIINRETALYPKGGATEDLNNDLIAWLKSRCHSWKPSEEQDVLTKMKYASSSTKLD